MVRSWEAADPSDGGGGGRAVSESLRVERNGWVLADTDESQWQAFVEGLVPLGIARLFFFDGEKIVGAADAAGGSSGGAGPNPMRESLDVLLGAELVDRLSADLDLYVARRAGRSGGDSGGEQGPAYRQYQDMMAERDALVAGVESLEAEVQSKRGQLEAAEAHVAEEEQKIRGAGGGYADLRAGLLAEKAAIEERLRGHERAVREALSGAAPLALASDLLGRAVSRIDADAGAARSAAAAADAIPKIDALRREMGSDSFWPGGRADDRAADLIARRLEEMFRHDPGDSAPPLFDVSEEEAAAVRTAAAAAASFPPPSLRGELAGLAAAEARLEEVVEGLARAPSDDEMAARVRGIRDAHREIGTLRAEIDHMGQRLSARQANLKVVRNRLKKLLDEMRRDERADKGVALAGRMKAALATYRGGLLARKMRELEENLLAVASVLLHKGGVERIVVDPETLEVGAYEEGIDEPVPLRSMGEQQMIGTALLWAIAKTSGRPLPFVIDTPLGRLDGAHLSNLVDRFYPSASHQTVLLSTDREIGPAEYARLRPRVARAYVIEFDGDGRRSAVREGYFGDGGGGAGRGGGFAHVSGAGPLRAGDGGGGAGRGGGRAGPREGEGA